MGYAVNYDINVQIAAENEAPTLAAINKLHESGEHYPWTGHPPPGGFQSLYQAFDAWRFDYDRAAGGQPGTLTYFTGEKCGDEEMLFEAIAPFAIGQIRALGEDGAQWGFDFEDGKLVPRTARVTWD